jgi:phosphomannomutase
VRTEVTETEIQVETRVAQKRRPETARPTVSHTASSITQVLDPKIFKAYDVRGIYPDELDEAGAYAIGRAYVDEFEPRSIAVGRDMRLSSPSMAEAAIRGAAEAGADVLDIGMVGTEMVYFAVGDLDLEGGIMLTASHNPAQFCRR